MGSTIVKGTVADIRFRNEENGYTVLTIGKGGAEQTVIGTLPFLKQGERVRVLGTWTTHPTFGRQLKAASYETIEPTRAEEIERYLASGVIKGVGENKLDPTGNSTRGQVATVIVRYATLVQH